MIRREILGLYRKYPRREGVWDCDMASAIGKWIMEKEEWGLIYDDPITESARLRIMEVKIPAANAKREAVVKYTLMEERDPRRRYLLPTETITW